MRRPELRCSSEAVSFLFVRSVLLLDDSDVMFVLILKDILPILYIKFLPYYIAKIFKKFSIFIKKIFFLLFCNFFSKNP